MRNLLIVLCLLTAAIAAEMPLMEPKDLVASLSARGTKPAIYYVGPNVFYRSKHVPGSIFAGPASKPEGLALLKAAVEKLPRDRDVVLYCGCCPWDKCPNVKPAADMLKEMGFRRVKVVYMPANFKTDWIDRGYPVE